MKKILLAFLPVMLVAGSAHAQRFLTEVFPSASKTADVVYGNNFSVLTGTPVAGDLKMDIYQPAGMTDTMAKRPLIIFMHTGSYLPAYLNQTPTGSRNDSAAVEICTRLARRGYVVANMDYRLGWNPASTELDVRRGTLLSAVYRSIQDAKACVRFFRKDAGLTNTYKIDSSKVILGGQGTGGYVALNYPCLTLPAQIALPKFISNTTQAAYGFQAGQPYINMALLGDYDGYGGTATLNNPNNSPGHTSNVQFVFNLGGALGDSSWLTAGAAPMVAFHVVGDPFAPYGNGIVYVPGTTPQAVVDVSRSGSVIPKANALGNNNCFKNAGFTDVYTVRANSVNGGQDGLFPLVTVPATQAGPWEWYDSTVVVMSAQAYGLSAAQGTAIYNNSLITNPNMSKTKALAYIDTIMNYLNPRIGACLALTAAGVHDAKLDNTVQVYPNPATDMITVRTGAPSNMIKDIEIADVTGRIVTRINKVNTQQYTISQSNLAPGIYVISINTAKGRFVEKLTIQ